MCSRNMAFPNQKQPSVPASGRLAYMAFRVIVVAVARGSCPDGVINGATGNGSEEFMKLLFLLCSLFCLVRLSFARDPTSSKSSAKRWSLLPEILAALDIDNSHS